MTYSKKVVAGLIVAAVIAVIGVGYSQVKGMSVEDALLYIGLPFLVILLVLGAWLGVSRVARTFRDMRLTIDSLLDHAGVAVNDDLLRLHLRDVIADAEAYGWSISSFHEGLMFDPPSGDASTFMRFHETQPEDVARQLHELSPQDFPEDWRAPTPNRLIEALSEADDEALGKLREADDLLMDQLRKATTRVEALERQLEKIASPSSNDLILALGILRSRGWVAEGMNGNTMYILRKEGFEPTYFDVEGLDVGKMFDAVGRLEAEHRAKQQP